MNEFIIADAIDKLEKAISSQDTFRRIEVDDSIANALYDVRDELKKINLNLISIKNELNDISTILEVK